MGSVATGSESTVEAEVRKMLPRFPVELIAGALLVETCKSDLAVL